MQSMILVSIWQARYQYYLFAQARISTLDRPEIRRQNMRSFLLILARLVDFDSIPKANFGSSLATPTWIQISLFMT